MKRLLACVAIVIVCAPGFGQVAQMHDGMAVPPATSLPPPVMISGVGHSHFPITTSSPQSQAWFDQGLSLLHCFWDFESLRAFQQAARLDPNCAMCQWGIYRAMNFGGSGADQLAPVVAKMKQLAPQASDHEQRYLRSEIETFGKKSSEASQTYEREMEAIIYRYPDDLDAKLLLALSLENGFDVHGDPRPGQLYAMDILRGILRDHPDDAAANHYWIHALEASPHPEAALDSAEKLAPLAPGSGHMVHMPGHIFYRIGDYERARRSFLDSMRIDEAYMRAQKIDPQDDRNYAHNFSYLIANSAEEGRVKEAREYAARLEPLAHSATDPTRPGSAIFYVIQIGGTRPRLAARFGDWQDAIDHPVDFGIPENQLTPAARTLRDGTAAYAKAMQSLDREDVDAGARESDRLDALLSGFLRDRDQADATAQRVGQILTVASKDLAGNVASHRGNYGRAKELLNEAIEAEKQLGYSEPPLYSRPSLESLGYAGIRAGQWEDARSAFRQVLVVRPKSGFGYYGIALTYDKEGNRGAAIKAYQGFLASWPYADQDLPMVVSARAALARLNATSQ